MKSIKACCTKCKQFRDIIKENVNVFPLPLLSPRNDHDEEFAGTCGINMCLNSHLWWQRESDLSCVSLQVSHKQLRDVNKDSMALKYIVQAQCCGWNTASSSVPHVQYIRKEMGNVPAVIFYGSAVIGESSLTFLYSILSQLYKAAPCMHMPQNLPPDRLQSSGRESSSLLTPAWKKQCICVVCMCI